jgi:hypothetical protein
MTMNFQKLMLIVFAGCVALLVSTSAFAQTNGTKVFDPAAERPTLNANEVKVFPVEKIYFSGTSNTVEARRLADIGNFVKERLARLGQFSPIAPTIDS